MLVLALRAPFGLAHNGLRLATGPLSGGLVMLVYGLHTRRKFEMAVGSGPNEPVNHKRAVHQRVREFGGLFSGSGRERIRSGPGPGFSVSEERTRPRRRERRNPLESTQNEDARPDAWSGVPVNRMVRKSSETEIGSGGWIRTSDQLVNSQLRYHCATPEQAVVNRPLGVEKSRYYSESAADCQQSPA